jgi:diguanylate cyclase (GGDEF)-like protein
LTQAAVNARTDQQIIGQGNVGFRQPRTVAIYDELGDAAARVLAVPGWEEVRVFSFRELGDLFRISLRHRVDLILMCIDDSLEAASALARMVDRHMSLAIIPAVIYQANPTREQIKRGLQSCADDYLWGEWDGELFGLRVRMIAERSNRDMAVNPTSQLPGPTLIEQEINARLQEQQRFAVCYLDIDDFKAYNDYRGYFYGDRIIRLVARIVRDIVADLAPESFVGHIGGDDFLFLLDPDQVDNVCSNVIRTFDRIVPWRYAEDDRERGQILTRNRQGEMKTFGLMTISIAVLIADTSFSHMGEMSHMLADLKSYTKSLSGSNYTIERRTRY